MSKVLVIKINQNSVEVADTSIKKTFTQIDKFFTINFNNNILSDEGIYGADNLAYNLKQELKNAKINTKDAIFVINSNSIYARKVDLPDQKNPKEFLNLLSVKVKEDNIFPIDLQNFYITYSEINSYLKTVVEQKKEEIKEENKENPNIQNTTENNDVVSVNAETSENGKSLTAQINTPKSVKIKECMAYVAPKNLIDGIITIAQSSKLNIKNIEYTGNSLVRYAIKGYDQNTKDLDWVTIQVTSMNTIVSVISKNKLISQHTVDFSYDDICAQFYENKQIFNQSTPEGVFKLIIYLDFLNRDDTKVGYEQLSPALRQFLQNFDEPTRNVILGVQSVLLEKLSHLTESINSFIMNARNNKIKPAFILYYSENDYFPNIIETLEYYTKLKVQVLKNEGKNIIIDASLINPIDFSLAVNIDKALTEKTNRIIFYEFFAAICVILVMVILNLFNLMELKQKAADWKSNTVDGEEAKKVYESYRDVLYTYEELKEFDDKTKNALNDLDKIFDELESVTMTSARMNVQSISGSNDTLNMTITADSKDTVVWFCQNLEELDYVDSVNWSSLTEITEADLTYGTGRKITTSFAIKLKKMALDEDENFDE